MDRRLEWLRVQPPYSDVIISSRVRLARDFVKIPFPHKASPEDAVGVVNSVADVVKKEGIFNGMELLYMDRMDDLQRRLLVEDHLISPEHAMGNGGRAVMLDDRGIVSIMINEEDHLRFQCILPGLQLMDALDIAAKMERDMGKHIEYAFDSQLGFLTAWPTNVGTGMRASVMVHLPAFVLSGRISNLITSVNKVGLAIRGVYGEGSASLGDMFQVSNQITLGPSEEEIVDNVEKIAGFIFDEEMKLREEMYKNERLKVEDKVWRALGILQNARSISMKEASNLLSLVRMGVTLEILPYIDTGMLNMLFLAIQPAHVLLGEEKMLSKAEMDIKRASVVRETLNGMREGGKNV